MIIVVQDISSGLTPEEVYNQTKEKNKETSLYVIKGNFFFHVPIDKRMTLPDALDTLDHYFDIMRDMMADRKLYFKDDVTAHRAFLDMVSTLLRANESLKILHPNAPMRLPNEEFKKWCRSLLSNNLSEFLDIYRECL